MAQDLGAPRSRRALLAAAAGSAAALAATAALPLTAAAHDADDVALGAANSTTAATTIANTTDDVDALQLTASGVGAGLASSSVTGVGVSAWSVTPTTLTPTDLSLTGVYGWAPTSADPNTIGAGVWGDSGDTGVIGTGSTGVFGYGGVGVWGTSAGTGAAIVAEASTSSDLALDVRGKVKFSRSGRAAIGKNKSSVKVTLAGVSTSSRVFAVLFTNRASRYVRAVAPTTGSFTIYLNASVSATTYVSWFVID